MFKIVSTLPTEGHFGAMMLNKQGRVFCFSFYWCDGELFRLHTHPELRREPFHPPTPEDIERLGIKFVIWDENT